MNTFMILEESVDPDDEPVNDVSSAETVKNTSSSNNTKPSKKEDEVRDLNLQELLDMALNTLQKKGLSNEEITAYAVKKQIKKVDKFNKKE